MRVFSFGFFLLTLLAGSQGFATRVLADNVFESTGNAIEKGAGQAGKAIEGGAHDTANSIQKGGSERRTPSVGQVAKGESLLGTAAWPKVRHGKYTEEAQS